MKITEICLASRIKSKIAVDAQVGRQLEIKCAWINYASSLPLAISNFNLFLNI